MKKIIFLLIPLLLILPIGALELPDEIPSERLYPYVVDDSGVFTDSEYSELLDYYTNLSAQSGCDIVFVITDYLNGRSAEDFADDFFDYGGFGQGANNDGMILLIALEDRYWHISTCGYGITALTDYGIDRIGDQLVPYMSDGDYYTVAAGFASLCDEYISAARNGTPIDIGNVPKEPVNPAEAFIIALVIGLISAIFAMIGMRSQLKSVRPKNSACDYTVSGSMNITSRDEIFLYNHISKVARPKDSGGSGGSSTHRSSSGRSHGGGGGRF